jgi:hypothetical protein
MEKLVAANAGALEPALAQQASTALKNRYSIGFWFMLVAEYHSVARRTFWLNGHWTSTTRNLQYQGMDVQG